jgi:hypothetical protein
MTVGDWDVDGICTMLESAMMEVTCESTGY